MISLTTAGLKTRLIATAIVAAIAAGLILAAADGGAAKPATAKAKGAKLFGLVTQSHYDDAIDGGALQELNPDSLRFLVAQGAVQTGEGACTAAGGGCVWTSIDHQVGAAAAAEAQALPLMFGLSSTPPLKGASARSWKQFLTAAAGRYGPGGVFWQENPGIPQKPIKVWQIWNEPGSPAYFKRPNPAAYVKLLELSGDTIRKTDARAKIMIAGLFASADRGAIKGRIPALDFLEQLYEVPGATKAFEFAALHPYSRDVSGVLAQIKQFRKIMNANGDSRTPLAITELGWSSNEPNDSLLAKGVEGQRQTLVKAFTALLKVKEKYRLDTVSWFSLRDAPVGESSCKNCPFSGLLEVDGTKKPAYDAFLSFTGDASN